MYYIRSCPSCDSELRFPIDKGTLIIKCPSCNNSFKIDPDDPSTYNLGRFDYSLPPSRKNLFRTFAERLSDILYLPVYLLKNNSSISGAGIKKAIPFILVSFVLLNLYQLCSQPNRKEIRRLEKLPPPVQSPQDNEEFPEDKKPQIDNSVKPEYEV
ncbi:MAG: hypothetical protein IT569_05940 [Leptospiraceae bacterium]|nr:hypothetical protein [Leptospiraceae bacterium]